MEQRGSNTSRKKSAGVQSAHHSINSTPHTTELRVPFFSDLILRHKRKVRIHLIHVIVCIVHYVHVQYSTVYNFSVALAFESTVVVSTRQQKQ